GDLTRIRNRLSPAGEDSPRLLTPFRFGGEFVPGNGTNRPWPSSLSGHLHCKAHATFAWARCGGPPGDLVVLLTGAPDRAGYLGHFAARRWRIVLAFSSSLRHAAGRPLPARLMKYWIMRIPEPIPLGLTFLLATW